MSDTERRQKILAVFEADLPEGIRILNAPAVTEEVEHGRDVTVQDDELASQQIYDADQDILVELIEEGILQAGTAFCHTVVGFSLEHQDKLSAEGKLGRSSGAE